VCAPSGCRFRLACQSLSPCPSSLLRFGLYCNTEVHTPFRNPVLVYTYVGKVCLCFSKFFSLLGGRVDPSTVTNIYVPTAEHNPPSMLSFRFWFSVVLGSILPSLQQKYLFGHRKHHMQGYTSMMESPILHVIAPGELG
jgi:hypothetical protein